LRPGGSFSVWTWASFSAPGTAPSGCWGQGSMSVLTLCSKHTPVGNRAGGRRTSACRLCPYQTAGRLRRPIPQSPCRGMIICEHFAAVGCSSRNSVWSTWRHAEPADVRFLSALPPLLSNFVPSAPTGSSAQPWLWHTRRDPRPSSPLLVLLARVCWRVTVRPRGLE